MYEQDLISAGLSEREAKVYLAALELGETTVDRIAKKSGVKRTTVYLEVESLKTKGLLSTINKGKKAYLFAEDPRILERKLEEKKEALQKSLPGILALANFIDKKPQIRFFESKEGVKEVLKDILRYPNAIVFSWISEDYVRYFNEDFFINYFIPGRVKNRIGAQTIAPENKFIREVIGKTAEGSIRKVRFVPSENFNLSIEMHIYGKNKVGILSCAEEIGLIIESQKIHDSLKSIFEAQWAGLPER